MVCLAVVVCNFRSSVSPHRHSDFPPIHIHLLIHSLKQINRQSLVKNQQAKILQVIIPSIFYPFYLRYPHQPWLTLNRAKVQSSFKDKLELHTK